MWGGICSPILGCSESLWPDHPSSLSLSLPRASLVPVYSFWENDVFHFKVFDTNSWQHLCQLTFKKIMGFSPCIFWGRGLFSANSWGMLPLARPITTVGECPSPGKKAAVSCAGRRAPPSPLSPLSLQWGAPSRCPSAWTTPRRKLTTITRCTWRLWNNSLRTTRKAMLSQLLLASPLSSPCHPPSPEPLGPGH